MVKVTENEENREIKIAKKTLKREKLKRIKIDRNKNNEELKEGKVRIKGGTKLITERGSKRTRDENRRQI